jgi:hypothetical protein
VAGYARKHIQKGKRVNDFAILSKRGNDFTILRKRINEITIWAKREYDFTITRIVTSSLGQ